MTASTRGLRDPRRFTVGTALLYLALLFGALLTLMPLVYMFTRAFMPEGEQMLWPVHWIPKQPTIDNFQRILNDPTLPVFRWLLNSVFVATAVTALVLFICSLTAYAYARLQFPGRDVIFFLLLTSLMVPGAVTFIPNFLLMRNLEWLDSYHGLIWLHGANVFGVFLLRQHFLSVPKELEEAAVVDGAGRFRIYWQVALPLVKSALVALGIFTFLSNWNDLFWPLVILSDRNRLTLPVGLQVLGGGNYVQRGLTMAAAALASTPPLILYAIFQRRIVAGITLTGMGGR
ncbi:MAG TPA: carbohydrate ABC transporter permease [Herpetosiphonaceae bacterium]|nr:carbohydrate ABC transporter permease [Herpetosiphonaceae bacterium]